MQDKSRKRTAYPPRAHHKSTSNKRAQTQCSRSHTCRRAGNSNSVYEVLRLFMPYGMDESSDAMRALKRRTHGSVQQNKRVHQPRQQNQSGQ
eukprot:6200357-Pleurochrysis_carterae.AAC.11